jgi:hypothetical protein
MRRISTKAKVVERKISLNLNRAVDKAHESKSIREILKLPPSALQGLTPEHDLVFQRLRIRSIGQLGKWKAYQIAHSINVMASIEDPDRRHMDAKANISRAIDKAHLGLSFAELCNQPPHVISGLAKWVDTEFQNHFRIKSVADLGNWKFARLAESLVQLSRFEQDTVESDSSSSSDDEKVSQISDDSSSSSESES